MYKIEEIPEKLYEELESYSSTELFVKKFILKDDKVYRFFKYQNKLLQNPKEEPQDSDEIDNSVDAYSDNFCIN